MMARGVHPGVVSSQVWQRLEGYQVDLAAVRAWGAVDLARAVDRRPPRRLDRRKRARPTRTSQDGADAPDERTHGRN